MSILIFLPIRSTMQWVCRLSEKGGVEVCLVSEGCNPSSGKGVWGAANLFDSVCLSVCGMSVHRGSYILLKNGGWVLAQSQWRTLRSAG
jgi:hypothetical protein